ncbi:MAG: NUDIX hydrolase [Janthinobacterium lividum]
MRDIQGTPQVNRRSSSIKQVAALPYRIDEKGQVQVLLITSRGTRRWVLPKGNRIAGLTPSQAAAQEAFEEAGVTGVTSRRPLGRYDYLKQRNDGSCRRATVDVYPLAFEAQANQWPEQHQRKMQWFDLPEAARAVDEADLNALIAAFRVPRRTGAAALAGTLARKARRLLRRAGIRRGNAIPE